MSIAGSNLGNIYTNDEGKGLAAIFDNYGFYKGLEIAQQQKGLRDRDKAQNAKMMAEAAPDVKWTPYIHDVQKGYEHLLDQAAGVMTVHGIDNIWKSTHPEAVKLQKGFSALGNVTNGVNALYEDYNDRIMKIHQNPEDYTAASVKEVQEFPNKVGIGDIASGQIGGKSVSIPTLRFKEPEKLYKTFYFAGSKSLTESAGEGGVVADSDIMDYTNTFFQAPANDTESRALKQSYDNLLRRQATLTSQLSAPGITPGTQATLQGELDDIKGTLRGAADYGRRMNTDDWVGLGASNIRRLTAPEVPDIGGITTKMAEAAPFAMSKIEGGIADGRIKTTRVKQLPKGSTYPEDRAQAWVNANRWILDRQDFISSLGLSGSTKDIEEGLVEKMAGMVRQGINREFERTSKSAGEGSGFGKEQLSENFSEWRKLLDSPDNLQAQDAARFVEGAAGFFGEGKVIDSFVTPTNIPFAPGKTLTLKFDDAKAAEKARDAIYKEVILGEGKKWTAEQKQIYKDHIDDLKARSKGDLVILPLDATQEQMLRKMYDQSVEVGDRIFEPFGGNAHRGGSEFGGVSGSTKTFGGVPLNR